MKIKAKRTLRKKLPKYVDASALTGMEKLTSDGKTAGNIAGAAGAIGGMMTAASDDPNEGMGQVGSVLSGAASGAAAGAMFGPWGAAIGGVGGGAMAYFNSEKAQAAGRARKEAAAKQKEINTNIANVAAANSNVKQAYAMDNVEDNTIPGLRRGAASFMSNPNLDAVSPIEIEQDVPFPYNGKSMYKGGYNLKRANELYKPDATGHLPSVDSTTGEWLKDKDYPTAWKEYKSSQLNLELNKEVGNAYQNEKGKLQYPKGYAKGSASFKSNKYNDGNPNAMVASEEGIMDGNTGKLSVVPGKYNPSNPDTTYANLTPGSSVYSQDKSFIIPGGNSTPGDIIKKAAMIQKRNTDIRSNKIPSSRIDKTTADINDANIQKQTELLNMHTMLNNPKAAQEAGYMPKYNKGKVGLPKYKFATATAGVKGVDYTQAEWDETVKEAESWAAPAGTVNTNEDSKKIGRDVIHSIKQQAKYDKKHPILASVRPAVESADRIAKHTSDWIKEARTESSKFVGGLLKKKTPISTEVEPAKTEVPIVKSDVKAPEVDSSNDSGGKSTTKSNSNFVISGLTNAAMQLTPLISNLAYKDPVAPEAIYEKNNFQNYRQYYNPSRQLREAANQRRMARYNTSIQNTGTGANLAMAADVYGKGVEQEADIRDKAQVNNNKYAAEYMERANANAASIGKDRVVEDRWSRDIKHNMAVNARTIRQKGFDQISEFSQNMAKSANEKEATKVAGVNAALYASKYMDKDQLKKFMEVNGIQGYNKGTSSFKRPKLKK